MISRINTRFFEDMAIAVDRLVSVSKNKAFVYRFESKHIKNQATINYSMDQESYDDENHNLTIEAKDSIISICLNHEGKFLLCNISMVKPRIECWNLDTGVCVKKYRGHQ